MMTMHSPERRVDTKALNAHLRSIGLVPNSSKWLTVWFRKRHKFLVRVR